jgi:hypothetical protein
VSGAALPYHLRPHKAVDRRLFLDLLTRYERWRPLAEYAYVSMGAYPLEDHKLIHRTIGIKKLIAFDLDGDVVARQHFNKPIESCYCLQKKSGELIAQLDSILTDCSFPAENGLVIWLDYTDPTKIGEQIREFEALLDKSRAGDVVRVTVNAHPHAFLEESSSDAKPLLAEEKRKKQFQKLETRIGDFLPSWAKPENMTSEELPLVISEAFSAAALKALPVNGVNVFVPLSIIKYADGQQMLSITGAVVRRGDETAMLDRLELEGWPFASADWRTIHQLVVPHLTVRERLFLERGVISKSPEDLMKELGFEVAADVRITDFLENYKSYYRFYPTLLSAEL